MTMQPQPIATVAALCRFPVKSMRGQELSHTRVGWHSFEGDRRYAFLRTNNQTHFPWLTGREVARMLAYTPLINDLEQPHTSTVSVTTPAQETLPIDSSALRHELEQLAGEPIHLMHLGRGAFDSSLGISLLSTRSIQTLSQAAQIDLEPIRFRINIIVKT